MEEGVGEIARSKLDCIFNGGLHYACCWNDKESKLGMLLVNYWALSRFPALFIVDNVCA